MNLPPITITRSRVRRACARDIRDVRAAIRSAHLAGQYGVAAVLRVNLNLLIKIARSVARKNT